MRALSGGQVRSLKLSVTLHQSRRQKSPPEDFCGDISAETLVRGSHQVIVAFEWERQNALSSSVKKLVFFVERAAFPPKWAFCHQGSIQRLLRPRTLNLFLNLRATRTPYSPTQRLLSGLSSKPSPHTQKKLPAEFSHCPFAHRFLCVAHSSTSGANGNYETL